MTAAGGLYSSAADLARFLRFQLNDGSIDGRGVLDPKWLDEMRTVPPPRAGAPAGYALGVVRHRWNTLGQRPDLFDHGGGGYGFLSDLWWLPQLGVGIAVLTNSQDHQLQNELALSILADLVSEPGVYRDRAARAAAGGRRSTIPTWSFDPPAGIANLVADAAMAATGDEATRWAGYSGLYRAPAWGVLDPDGPPDRFVVDAGVPYFEAEDETESLVRHRLVEVEPGLFLADNGETLDLRGPVPTWRSFRLVRVSGGPSQWQWAILGAAALLAVAWLVAALARHRPALALRVAGSAKPRPAGGAGSRRRWPVPPHCCGRQRGPARVAARARRRRIPGLARALSGPAAGAAPAAGRRRARRLHGCSRCVGADRALVVDVREAAVRRPCGRGGRGWFAPGRVAPHRVEPALVTTDPVYGCEATDSNRRPPPRTGSGGRAELLSDIRGLEVGDGGHHLPAVRFAVRSGLSLPSR